MKLKKLGLIALLFTVAACYEHTYHVGAGAPMGTVTYDQWRHHWLWGLIDPGSELELRQLCPSGDATIEQEQSFLNGLVTVLTSGIYSPTTVQIRCAGASASLDLSADEVERIVTTSHFLDWVGAMAPDRLREASEAQQALADS